MLLDREREASASIAEVKRILLQKHSLLSIWEDHFRWSEDFLKIIGITATGRATVVALQLNRQQLINLRRAVYLLGEHPPK